MQYVYEAKLVTREFKKEFTYENEPVLQVSIQYPEVALFGNKAAADNINRFYKNNAKAYFTYASTKLLSDAISNYEYARQNKFPFHMYDAVMKYTVTLNANCYLSTYIDQYEYTGGAHGNTVRTSQNFSLKSGRGVLLPQLFPPGVSYRKMILSQIIKMADQNVREGQNIYFDNYKELIIKNFNPKSFNLNPDTVSFYYQQYEIGPYVSGIITFDIPYEAIGAKRPRC
ncbi:MAG: hypothetical protein BGN88_05885 [Clostridiales bacterium 43-6]|nr:MAG: hypothetical protein BGN88_05885 [Clostridiales bacterium 43-6]